MKDWEDLLDIDVSEFREEPKKELEEQRSELFASDKASIDLDIDTFNPRVPLSDEQIKKLENQFKDEASVQGRIRTGACQMESDGDITCKFKLDSPVKVPLSKGFNGTREIPVAIDGKLIVRDFNEASAHDMNKIRKENGRVVVS